MLVLYKSSQEGFENSKIIREMQRRYFRLDIFENYFTCDIFRINSQVISHDYIFCANDVVQLSAAEYYVHGVLGRQS